MPQTSWRLGQIQQRDWIDSWKFWYRHYDPTAQLELSAPSGVVGLRITSVRTETSYIDFADQDDNNTGSIAYYHPNNSMQFKTNDLERMRIDSQGKIGIGTETPAAPLDVTSTTGGVIMPRMTTTEMNAVAIPSNGEMIYNTTENKFYGHVDGSWVALH